MDALITKKLINTEVKKNGITVSQADIDKEIANIEAQISGQGMTLGDALAQQGMTVENLREQIMIQKELEVLLADKLAVTDDEVNQYLKESKLLPSKGVSSEDQKNQVREQLKGQKFNQVAKEWLDNLKASATIRYFVNY